jgi:hypothetical protein
MNASDSLQALRRANPRAQAGFAESVQAAAEAARARIVLAPPVIRPARPTRRAWHIAAALAPLAAIATAAAFLVVGSPGNGPGIENATAAVRQAAAVTSASAERSGTAAVRITHNGALWAGTTIRWIGEDLAISSETPGRDGRPGSELLVVDGVMYGVEDGRWIVLGPPESVDPDSGTTPAEYLAAVREDVGGPTLRRLAAGMTDLTTSRQQGSTVYRGQVAAGSLAREAGFKEGRTIRVLPFGFVAHGEAADPSALLDSAVTVTDGVVRQIAVGWGSGASAWTYTVTYKNLASSSPIVAPANAKPFPNRNPFPRRN